MILSFKGRHFPEDLMLMAVRWKLAYLLSYRHIEELLEERGTDVDLLVESVLVCQNFSLTII